MKIYLGKDPDSFEAIEFLCLAEGGEVTHYELLSVMAKGVKNKKLATNVKAILAEEKRHLQLCTRLAKEIDLLMLSIIKTKTWLLRIYGSTEPNLIPSITTYHYGYS